MKNDVKGLIIGCLVGTVLTGVAIYFTNNPWCFVICIACGTLGSSIGASIDKKNKTKPPKRK